MVAYGDTRAGAALGDEFWVWHGVGVPCTHLVATPATLAAHARARAAAEAAVAASSPSGSGGGGSGSAAQQQGPAQVV